MRPPLSDEGTPPSGHDDFLDLSWEMFGELCRALAMKVSRRYDPELIVGIARAGVIPAAVMASILRRDLYAMTISRREAGERVRERPAVLSAAPLQAEGRRVLLVDEITTSGDTLRLAVAALRDVNAAEIRSATAFVRPQAHRPDYYGLETDSTVIFPWDRKVFDGQDWVVNPMYKDVIEE